MIKATFKINDIDLSNIILYDVTPTPINSQINRRSSLLVGKTQMSIDTRFNRPSDTVT